MRPSAMPVFVCLIAFHFSTTSANEDKSSRWEESIKKFEAMDKLSPPEKSGVLFIGSSSIRNWNLEKYFPKQDYINRGFGGSEIVDSTYFAKRIITPYAPRVIVLYAGDNDIARGKSPEQVVADFREFVKVVQTELPSSRIVFIAIKPSISRWKLVDKMRVANTKIKAITENQSRLSFVDIDKPIIGKDGMPRRELFAKDGLHLSDAGYKLWTSLVKPHLGQKPVE